ncbi:MAG: galactose-binding domain-containing protein, partial [Thermoguttaceae bacterium]
MSDSRQARSVAIVAGLLLATALPASAGQTDMAPLLEADWVLEDQRFQVPKAAPKPAAAPQVTTQSDAAGGCDGVKTGRVGFHTASGETDPWWQVDLGRPVTLDRVVVFNRTDCSPERTATIRLLTAPDAQSPQFEVVYEHDGTPFLGANENRPLVVQLAAKNVTAQIVRLQVPGRCSFALDEIEVYGRDDPNKNLALHRPADQKSIGPYSVVHETASLEPAPAADEPTTLEFSPAHTRAVIDRARHLAARLAGDGAGERLAPLTSELNDISRRVEQLQSAGTTSLADRREHYFQARRLLRRIAFCNPLLDFDRILFIKRHDAAGLYHMVHQYYGFGAVPGGGLFVLSNPFSDRPGVSNLLEKSVVAGGRLAGQRLLPGTFLSPELSFDGRKILFAYTQGLGEKPEWSPRACYHLFEVASDGSGLAQLTDGPWEDFDPCFLPGGRIAFVSTRRGGYLRCGGSAPPWDSPTYTLYSMAGDGSDIVCLSFHETQEWHPSVDNNGMLIYTRWDYVDRDTNVAHHLWNCYPDGRDPRSFHGNYPTDREKRPWMEMSPRAIPGSNRYVATAAAHHGHAFGSLVAVDYRTEDDGAMAQVERLTPDVPLPESEGEKSMIRQYMAYGTPWPLSEDDYLCVYHPEGKNRGIYWIDRYGNRELLYRDPEISCLSLIPLRPRPTPPALPSRTVQTAADKAAQEPRPATIAVMNVYDGDFSWPAGTRIHALRIIQVLP